MADTNEGIIITGGTVNVGAMAQGAGARATARNVSMQLSERGLGDVADKLDELVAALERHGAELPDQDGAAALTGRVAEELAREEPDKPTVLGFLSRLAQAATSVSSIAAAVTALEHVVVALL